VSVLSLSARVLLLPLLGVAFFIDEGPMVEIILLFLAPKFLKVKHLLIPNKPAQGGSYQPTPRKSRAVSFAIRLSTTI
jgi:hypothetical protein